MASWQVETELSTDMVSSCQQDGLLEVVSNETVRPVKNPREERTEPGGGL